MARILAAMAAVFLLFPQMGNTQVMPHLRMDESSQLAIREVIQAQLSALQHDDGVQAFFYASPMIRSQFHTPEIFLDMVKTAYPAVYRPRDTQFRELEATEDGPVQKVFFFGPDGRQLAEPLVGAMIPDFYGAYFDAALAKATNRLQSLPK